MARPMTRQGLGLKLLAVKDSGFYQLWTTGYGTDCPWAIRGGQYQASLVKPAGGTMDWPYTGDVKYWRGSGELRRCEPFQLPDNIDHNRDLEYPGWLSPADVRRLADVATAADTESSRIVLHSVLLQRRADYCVSADATNGMILRRQPMPGYILPAGVDSLVLPTALVRMMTVVNNTVIGKETSWTLSTRQTDNNRLHIIITGRLSTGDLLTLSSDQDKQQFPDVDRLWRDQDAGESVSVRIRTADLVSAVESANAIDKENRASLGIPYADAYGPIVALFDARLLLKAASPHKGEPNNVLRLTMKADPNYVTVKPSRDAEPMRRRVNMKPGLVSWCSGTAKTLVMPLHPTG